MLILKFHSFLLTLLALCLFTFPAQSRDDDIKYSDDSSDFVRVTDVVPDVIL